MRSQKIAIFYLIICYGPVWYVRIHSPLFYNLKVLVFRTGSRLIHANAVFLISPDNVLYIMCAREAHTAQNMLVYSDDTMYSMSY